MLPIALTFQLHFFKKVKYGNYFVILWQWNLFDFITKTSCPQAKYFVLKPGGVLQLLAKEFSRLRYFAKLVSLRRRFSFYTFLILLWFWLRIDLMWTSAFKVQTHATRRDGKKASRANNHSCFDFFSRFRFSLSSEIKYCKSIFQHIVRESFFGIA